MKVVVNIAGTLVTLFLVVFALQWIASESGEVVVVTTTAENGSHAETRLWIVEHGDLLWLRSGSEISGWYQRMLENPRVQVERGEQSFAATVAPRPSKRDAINASMNEKYGWADDFIGLLFGRDDSIPLLLTPE